MVVPTYNEVENLADLVARVRGTAPSVDILVVDDSSPDGTGLIADQLAAVDPQVRVLHRATKDGLGAAYLDGFAVALERGYTLIGEMDADGSHRPEDLPRLLQATAYADLVIGSRYVPGGTVVGWSRHRRLLSSAGNSYARRMLRLQVNDITAGYRIFRRSTLLHVGLDDVRSTGYCFQADLTRRAALLGLTISEVPIEFADRVRGKSKLDGSVAMESLWRITSWGLADRRHRRAVASAAPSTRCPLSDFVLPCDGTCAAQALDGRNAGYQPAGDLPDDWPPAGCQ